MRRRVFMVAGYNTISLGTGRKEFHPKKSRPELEDYIKEAGQATIQQLGGASIVDETVIGNFMASRFNNQSHLAAFAPAIDPLLRYKPSCRVEGACASGGLAMITAIKSVLAGTADVVLALGVEVQNSVKAMYGADHLALAGHYKDRKNGHAYFFPGKFSDRTAAYAKKYGEDYARQGMAQWYANCIDNAKHCPTAQEFESNDTDPLKKGMLSPNGKRFVGHLNLYDCSKVSDGASSIAVVSEEGLKKAGITQKQAIELVGFAQVEDDICNPPDDPTELATTKVAAQRAIDMANITIEQLATVETHDCFTIAGILATEAIGFAPKGQGAEFVKQGHTSRNGIIPFNTTGGLIGWGHPTGATGVHQVVTLWEQLTNRAGDAQINIPKDKPYGMTVNMGGDDKTVVAMVFKQ